MGRRGRGCRLPPTLTLRIDLLLCDADTDGEFTWFPALGLPAGASPSHPQHDEKGQQTSLKALGQAKAGAGLSRRSGAADPPLNPQRKAHPRGVQSHSVSSDAEAPQPHTHNGHTPENYLLDFLFSGGQAARWDGRSRSQVFGHGHQLLALEVHGLPVPGDRLRAVADELQGGQPACREGGTKAALRAGARPPGPRRSG